MLFVFSGLKVTSSQLTGYGRFQWVLLDGVQKSTLEKMFRYVHENQLETFSHRYVFVGSIYLINVCNYVKFASNFAIICLYHISCKIRKFNVCSFLFVPENVLFDFKCSFACVHRETETKSASHIQLWNSVSQSLLVKLSQ